MDTKQLFLFFSHKKVYLAIHSEKRGLALKTINKKNIQKNEFFKISDDVSKELINQSKLARNDILYFDKKVWNKKKKYHGKIQILLNLFKEKELKIKNIRSLKY